MSCLSRINEAWITGLEIEGVLCHGYGIIPKMVMRDRRLTAEAKAIYGYLCSLSGRGNTICPGRDLILADLGISKDRYYKHRKALLELEYISVHETRNDDGSDFAHNIYRLNTSPRKDTDSDGKEQAAGLLESQIEVEGIEHDGYGIVPRAVMIDDRLDIKSKAVYLYLSSFAGSGPVAFPKVTQITAELVMSDKAYQAKMSELKKLGYISVRQEKNPGKKTFGRNIYTLCRNVVPMESGKAVPPKQGHAKPYPIIKDTQNEDARFKDAQIKDINNNSSSTLTDKSKTFSHQIREDEIKEQIRLQINYSSIAGTYLGISKETADLIVDILSEPFLKTGQGSENIRLEEIRGKFRHITEEQVRTVCKAVEKRESRINDRKKYLRTALLNAAEQTRAVTSQMPEQNTDRAFEDLMDLYNSLSKNNGAPESGD